ncbi:uncharacterized protein MELLADRAFT_118621 [Melampsora larici-populina 98AG31]|uniref:Alpha-type protein kinase domain-containing protein n=1 Tax=Melampsora larici-populina (strain 98AG31 / pathotype 3-4-7) TaxID=747676 RepID=F4SBE2_MELLP|nr:uncharacterized protein MELLADRAFT_118621 [Melampsora larici-populina 98AG31]EGF98012.1 hypothetical protein MELLADRAFT_118621 [Melampsora larici-populina 98AG31]
MSTPLEINSTIGTNILHEVAHHLPEDHINSQPLTLTDSSDSQYLALPGTVSDQTIEAVPYYEDLEDLGRKEEGTLYRLKPKGFRNTETYDQKEDVIVLEDRVVFKCYHEVDDKMNDDWIVRRIYFSHKEIRGLIRGFHFIKFHKSWVDLPSQGRPECFALAESNRHVAMALKSFKYMIFVKRKKGTGKVIPKYQKWYSYACAMAVQTCHVLQSAGSQYENDPRWMICESATDKSHSFVYEDNFHNPPSEPNTWTKLINAFLHYTYNLSNNQTLISSLDCDEHGQISNLLCYVRNSPPYHGRDDPKLATLIDRQFKLFEEQHVCNKICEMLGNVPF